MRELQSLQVAGITNSRVLPGALMVGKGRLGIVLGEHTEAPHLATTIN
jgi:hypothetical protein